MHQESAVADSRERYLRDLLKQRYEDRRSERKRWTLLIFALAVVLSATIAAILVLAVAGRETGGALTAVAAVVEGGALAWLVRRRNVAAKEEHEMYEEIKLDAESARAPAPAAAPSGAEPAAAAPLLTKPPSEAAQPGAAGLWASFKRLPTGVQLAGWIFTWPILTFVAIFGSQRSTTVKVGLAMLALFVMLVMAVAAEELESGPGSGGGGQTCFDALGQEVPCQNQRQQFLCTDPVTGLVVPC